MRISELIELYAVLLAMMYVGMTLGFMISELGLEARISKLLKPLLRAAELPSEAGVAIVTYAISPAAAHGILGSLYDKGVLGERDIIASILIGSFMVKVYYLFRFYVPYALPVLGPVLGSAYLVYAFASSLVIASIGALYAKLSRDRGSRSRGSAKPVALEEPSAGGSGGFKEALARSARKAWKLYVKVVWKLLVALSIVALLLYVKAFELLGEILASTVQWLTAAQLAVAVAMVASPIAALPIAGELYRRGMLTLGQALTAMIVGRMIFISVNDMPKAALPLYLSVYGRRLGIKAYLAVWSAAMFAWSLLLIATLVLFR